MNISVQRLAHLLALSLLIALYGSLNAQILEPARWSYAVEDKAVQIGGETDLIFSVSIDPKWYLYSSDFDPDVGPKVTTFIFEPNPGYELVGDVKAVGAKEKFDEIFEGNIRYFKNTAEFRQTIKVLKPEVIVSGTYEYQVCSDIDGRCIPFDEEFSMELTAVEQQNTESTTSTEQRNKKEEITQTDTAGQDKTLMVQPLREDSVDQDEQAKTDEAKSITGETGAKKNKTGIGTMFLKRDSQAAYSLLAFMIFAFIGGIGAVMTPCVYPMIPMTVAFFSKGTENKRRSRIQALAYGFSIIFIFTVIGIAVTLIFGPEVWNEIATSAVANILFFTIFFVFALSFFGLFDITLPSGFVNNIDKKADKGGLIGVFFMALTLVVVSFSCTAPIAGMILIESTQGSIVKPAFGMFAFSLAFAIPFTLFAIFPGWLNNLPKSGGWLNSVKVVLGFLELALGLKFLSVADTVYHWGLLDRDVYIAIWIVIFTLLGLYLLGKIKMPHDSDLKHVSVFRLLLVIVTFSFVVYLIPGLWGAPLKPLAGYLPPISSQDFNMMQNRPGAYFAGSKQNSLCDEPKFDEFLDFPYAVKGYFDYQQALECAREQNKPLFLDFTGHGCVNCREMEATVLSDPEVLKILNEEYVVVALYVDEKRKLPESDWYISEYDGKLKKTIGKQNADFQIVRYSNNAQPYYVLLDNQERLLAEPVAYDLEVSNFVDYLLNGLAAYRERTDDSLAVR